MSQHHRAQKWTSHAPRLRVQHTATLPRPCIDCGSLVTSTDAWQVGHVRAAMHGGKPTFQNTGPSHTACNRKAGGKMGARVTNSRRRRAQDLREW
jgi:hypothetical protein